MHSLTDIMKNAISEHVPEPESESGTVACRCGIVCSPDSGEKVPALMRHNDHQAEAVAERVEQELLATVNEAALHLARVAAREHSCPPDMKLEAGVKGYLYALLNRKPAAEFGEEFFSYPSVNELRSYMRAR